MSNSLFMDKNLVCVIWEKYRLFAKKKKSELKKNSKKERKNRKQRTFILMYN